MNTQFSEKLQGYLSNGQWMVAQDDYNPYENLKYESLFCLTNGYLGTREAMKRAL